MGPKFIVVVIRKDGSTTITKHYDEAEARAAFDLEVELPGITDAYLATVRTEGHW